MKYFPLVLVLAITAASRGITLAGPPAPVAANRDGKLAIAVTTAKAQFAAGEQIKLVFEFTNGGTFDVCLYNKLFDLMYADDKDFARCADIRFIDVKTKEVWQVVCGAEILRKAHNTPTVVLKPDVPYLQPFEFEEFLQFVPKDGKARESLPAGIYEARVTLHFQNYPGSKMPYWSGTVASKPVRVEIVVTATPKG